MEIKNFLIEQIKKRYEAQTVITDLEKKVERMAERMLFEKYEGHKIFIEDLEFSMGGGLAKFWNFDRGMNLNTVKLELVFFCSSKLSKTNKDIVEKAKEEYKIGKSIRYINLKIPLWHFFRFRVDLDSVLNNNINIKIQ